MQYTTDAVIVDKVSWSYYNLRNAAGIVD